MKKPREIVMVSGKGGTGKTSVAAAFADLSADSVFCDCDVDAANLALVLGGREKEEHEFIASTRAQVDPVRCTGCGLCKDVCRFDAFEEPGVVLQESCEGCGLCSRVCPAQAIRMEPVLSGYWYVSETKKGPLIHARLEPGEENSGKLVTLVRQKAREIAQSTGRTTIVTDGPPGIGCPVIASISGADFAVVVTEPTLSGIHDLERILDVCRQFKVPAIVCINKYDIHEENSRRIERQCEEMGARLGAKIPYDESVPRAMVRGLPVTRYSCPASDSIRELWEKAASMS